MINGSLERITDVFTSIIMSTIQHSLSTVLEPIESIWCFTLGAIESCALSFNTQKIAEL